MRYGCPIQKGDRVAFKDNPNIGRIKKGTQAKVIAIGWKRSYDNFAVKIDIDPLGWWNVDWFKKVTGKKTG